MALNFGTIYGFYTIDFLINKLSGRMFQYLPDSGQFLSNGSLFPNFSPSTGYSESKSAVSFDLSIEQDFMHEHTHTFLQQLALLQISLRQHCSLLSNPLASGVSGRSATHLLQYSQAPNACVWQRLVTLSQEAPQMGQFMVDLKREEKLLEFLEMSLKHTSSEFTADLLLMAERAWRCYIPLSQKRLEDDELLELAEEEIQGSQLRCISYTSESKIAYFVNNFLRYYYVTVLSVLNNKFCNMYYEDQLNQEDNEGGMQGGMQQEEDCSAQWQMELNDWHLEGDL